MRYWVEVWFNIYSFCDLSFWPCDLPPKNKMTHNHSSIILVKFEDCVSKKFFRYTEENSLILTGTVTLTFVPVALKTVWSHCDLDFSSRNPKNRRTHLLNKSNLPVKSEDSEIYGTPVIENRKHHGKDSVGYFREDTMIMKSLPVFWL